jgi:peptidoglycan/LPS O-acetylase OafA/YrhL
MTNPLLQHVVVAVEEQFYVFWPLLVLLGLQVWRSRRALVAMLTLLTLGSLAVCI